MKNSILLGIVFCLSVGSVLLFNGCMQTNNPSNITIRFPQASKKLVNEVGAFSNNSPWSGQLTAATNINCYAVMVGGPEPDMSHSYCDSTAGTRLMTFGHYAGGVSAGGSISIEVPPGLERNIYLAAMQAQNGACVDFHGTGPAQGQITHPRLIQKIATSLDPGEQRSIVINIPSDLTSLPEIDQCEVNDFPDGAVTVPVSLFGDGRDGSFQTAVTHTLNFDSDTFSGTANLGYTASATDPQPGSKFFSSARFVSAINANGSHLTLDSFGGNTNQFAPGDEILWLVASRFPSGANSTAACGGNLVGGTWGISKISNVVSSVIELETPISSTSNLNVANIAATNLDNNQTHCRIQVSRVPSFDLLQVDGSSPLTINISSLDANRVGGVVAFRAKELRLNDNLNINVSFDGYSPTASGQGGGLSGSGLAMISTKVENGAGGNNNGDGGAGGGNGGAGGDSSSNLSIGGSALHYCTGSFCLPVRDQRATFGGAGGSESGTTGGKGGGIVILHIEKITGSGQILITANGQDGTGMDGGGGAGGAVHVTTRQIDSNLTVQAVGGLGTSTTGGGGGGGLVEVVFCDADSSFTPANTSGTDVNAGLGGGGSNGSSGEYNVRNESSICL